jgi:hypothetical protein
MPVATKTQLIGGSFQDSLGNPLENGYLILHLSQDCLVSGVGTIAAGIDVQVQLDSTGNVASSTSTPPAANQFIWSNLVMTPQNNFYRVTGFTAAGQRAFGPNNQQVASGSVFNLDAWIPNTVISWFPSTQQALLLQVDGVANGVQTILNLESSDSSIIITDENNGTVNLQSASSGGLSGNGVFFFGPGITDYGTIYTNGGGAGSGIANGTIVANRVVVYLFVLTNSFTISQATTACFTNLGGQTATFGIYSFSGNKLVDAGQFVTLTAPGNQTNSFSPVTLPPGTYWHAQATTSASNPTFPGFVVSGGSASNSFASMLVKNNVRAAIAANSLSAGTLPLTLGALTPFLPNSPNGDGICAPLYE